MTYKEILVLIPSHSLEDFPTEANEDNAAGLLNAFSVIWHPALVANTEQMPTWGRADDPPEELEQRLIIIPDLAHEWLPSGWAGYAENHGATVVTGLKQREELAQAILQGLELPEGLDHDLVADFYALGTSHLMLELLTRHMHHFTNLDEHQLHHEAQAAAKAVMELQPETAKLHLRSAFEALANAREQFYPVECYLLDLCLVIPSLADDHFQRTLQTDVPLNVLLSGSDLQEIAETRPEIIPLLKSGIDAGTVNIVGGERKELEVPLVPLESMLYEFEQGARVYRQHLDRIPQTFGRRRFGLTTQLPQILTKWDYHTALHIVLDEGVYPDLDQSKIRWEGCDGSMIDAMTRLPLAADSAASFLRLPERLAETMEQDHIAALIFARWPELRTPWMNDLHRMARYAPVLGVFQNFDQFHEHDDASGYFSKYDEWQYFSPFLIYHAARKQADPISCFARNQQRRLEFDSLCWYRAMSHILYNQPVNQHELAEQEETLEQAGTEGDTEALAAAETVLDSLRNETPQQLANIIKMNGGDQDGFLLLNPLAATRTVSVELPELTSPPKQTPAIKAIQFDNTYKAVVAEIPGSGFLWIPKDGQGTASEDPPVPLAEDLVLRNEFFEVHINEATGGIGRIKEYGRKDARLSQQIAYRFPTERTWYPEVDGVKTEEKSFCSDMRCRSVEVTSSGPALGEIITRGDFIDQVNESTLGTYRQTVRVWRSRRVVEIDLQLDLQQVPDGDPWTNYWGMRFAWNDMTAALTRSVLLGAHGFQGERFESPHYLEIADADERTTILNHGLTFHRKTGVRMLDTILITANESQRHFKLTIAIDDPYPMQAALDAELPVTQLPNIPGPPPAGESGWFLHLPAKNIQITRLLDLINPPADLEDEDPADDSVVEPDSSRSRLAGPEENALPPNGFTVRLVETEGRPRTTKLQCFKTPSYARTRDFQGKTLTVLNIENDAVEITLGAYEIADVELRFG